MATSALSSLVFDCEVPLAAEDAGPRSSGRMVIDRQIVLQRLEVFSRESCPFARELRVHVGQALGDLQGQVPSVRNLGVDLALRGFTVLHRNALAGQGADCFKSLRHEFLVVRGDGEFNDMEFIVEPSLRQHFTVPHPSPDYAFALASAPDVFVGSSWRLVSIVQLLCALMADSFERQGLPLPPWRRETAMISKWLPQPNRLRDVLLPPFTLQPPSFPQDLINQQQQQAQDNQQQQFEQRQCAERWRSPADWSPCGRVAAAASTCGIDGQRSRSRETSYGYVSPSGPEDMAGGAAALTVWRTDSDSSSGSSDVGGVDGVTEGCGSPISVLPPSPPHRLPARKQQLGFDATPVRIPTAGSLEAADAAAAISDLAGAKSNKFSVADTERWPLVVACGRDASAAKVVVCGFQEPQAVLAGPRPGVAIYPREERSAGGGQVATRGHAAGYTDSASTRATAGGDAVSAPGTGQAGLLTQWLQQRTPHALATRPRAAEEDGWAVVPPPAFCSPAGRRAVALAASSGRMVAARAKAESTAPATPQPAAVAFTAASKASEAGCAALIRTRPPVHRGEMAIRVVKLYQAA